MTTPDLISFHGKQEVKDKLLENLLNHQELDQFIKGDYWEPIAKKGCAVGCTLIDYDVDCEDHSQFEILFGIPESLAQIEDSIFELLPVYNYKSWPVDFIKSIPVGVSLIPVIDKFMVFILSDKNIGCRQYASNKGKIEIDNIIDLFQRKLCGDNPKYTEWLADAFASSSAAAVYAARGEYPFAISAAANAAAFSAATDFSAAAAAVLREKHIIAYSEKLISLLKEMK